MQDFTCIKSNYSWLLTLGGNVIAPPVKTSYGYAFLTSGKMLSGISSDGNLLWENGLTYSPSPFLVRGVHDTLCTVISKSKIVFLNPTGMIFSSCDAGFEIIHKPLFAHDGRLFVSGSENAACIGQNGIIKWTARTERLSAVLEPALLNDGSVLFFLSDEDNGRTAA